MQEIDNTKTQTEEPNFFAVIPFPIMVDKWLPPQAKLLYGILSSLCKTKGYCWASNQYLAKQFKVHKTTISFWLSLLQKSNHIRIELYNNNTRKIYLTIAEGGLRQKAKGPTPKDVGLYNKYSKYNTVAVLRTGDKEIGLRPKLLDGIETKSIDKDLFLQFERVIRTHRKIFRKVYPKKWILEFQKLRRHDGIDAEDIKKVVKWYDKHIGEKYIPQAYSASSFRNKFLQLEAAMKRTGGDITVSKKAKQITKDLIKDELLFPTTSFSSYANAIQQTMSNWKRFQKAHHQIKNKYSIHNFAEYIGAELPTTIKEVIQYWFRYSKEPPVFDLDNKEFVKWGVKQSKNFSQDAGLWLEYIRLIKGIYENTKKD